MKPKNNTRLINLIRVYLITFAGIFILRLILGFGTLIVSFIRDGKLTFNNFTFIINNLIILPKGIIINPFLDGLIAILIGLIISTAIVAIVYYLLRFSENLLASEVLSKENGKYLRMCGILLSSVTFLNIAQKYIFNINTYTIFVVSSTTIKVLLAFLMIILGVVMHPLFWLGMFSILFGKIIDMATDVKQENDLTV